jgi:hypothetical protein
VDCDDPAGPGCGDTGNHPPTADAGPDIVIELGESTMLDCSRSFDPDWEVLVCRWQIIESPEDSTATLSSDDGPLVRFEPDRRGSYSVGLVVSDEKHASEQDVVVVSVE